MIYILVHGKVGPLICAGRGIVCVAGTRGKNTRDSVSWTATIPVPTVPGKRHRVPGSQSDGVQVYYGCGRYMRPRNTPQHTTENHQDEWQEERREQKGEDN